jgi:hypothetical protein
VNWNVRCGGLKASTASEEEECNKGATASERTNRQSDTLRSFIADLPGLAIRIQNFLFMRAILPIGIRYVKLPEGKNFTWLQPM